MKGTALLIAILLLGVLPVYPDNRDSATTAPSPKGVLKATTRLHSMGMFSYGGRLVSHNHVADMHIIYTRPTWGFQFFKAFDLGDGSTPINFALAAFNRPIHFGSKLTVTPHVGVVFEQFRSFADHGSDAAMILITAWRLQPHLTLEHSAMVANLVAEPELRDWVNRLRLLYSKGYLDVTLFAWHNNGVFDSSEYATLGVSLFMSRLPLAGPFKMQSGITALYMTSASEERTMAGANGLFLTVGVNVN